MSFLYNVLTRRLGVGFSIHARSLHFEADALGIRIRRLDEWEASWSPEDGALWETRQPCGKWSTWSAATVRSSEVDAAAG